MDNSSLIKSPISEELRTSRSFLKVLSPVPTFAEQRNCAYPAEEREDDAPHSGASGCEAFGKVCPATLHAAVALELLHNASLVHDDVVDESTERRGQLSVNAIFNNKVAVLAGDYLLATALVQVGMTRNHDIIDIVSCLGQDLADGELLQLSNVSNLHFSEEVYFDVIRKKTAVLFAACTKAGALGGSQR